MKRWPWVVVVMALPAFATSLSRGDNDVTTLGWTVDGRSFVWSGYDESSKPYWEYFDVSTGSVHHTAGDVSEWKKTHPLAPKRSGREGPGGLKAEVIVNNGSRSGKWNAEGTQWQPDGTSGWELRVVRDGKSRVSVGAHESSAYLEAHWSPDGKRVAWVERGAQTPTSGPPDVVLSVSAAGLPRVHVLGDKALLRTVAPKLSAALEQQNLITTYVGKALKQRAQSVIYAQPGSEADAKKAAEQVPGGATVEKLTWKADAELVVALGSSAGEKR